MRPRGQTKPGRGHEGRLAGSPLVEPSPRERLGGISPAEGAAQGGLAGLAAGSINRKRSSSAGPLQGNAGSGPLVGDAYPVRHTVPGRRYGVFASEGEQRRPVGELGGPSRAADGLAGPASFGGRGQAQSAPAAAPLSVPPHCGPRHPCGISHSDPCRPLGRATSPIRSQGAPGRANSLVRGLRRDGGRRGQRVGGRGSWTCSPVPAGPPAKITGAVLSLTARNGQTARGGHRPGGRRLGALAGRKGETEKGTSGGRCEPPRPPTPGHNLGVVPRKRCHSQVALPLPFRYLLVPPSAGRRPEGPAVVATCHRPSHGPPKVPYPVSSSPGARALAGRCRD